jgi:hypothetical protein
MRNAQGQFVKGYGFWTGKKRPGLKTSTSFKKGFIPWNAGTAKTKNCITCGKIFKVTPRDIQNNARYCSHFCRRKENFCIDCGMKIHLVSKRCRVCANKGQFSPFYKHGLASQNWSEREIIKATAKYRKWRKAVFERDNYTCQICGIRGNYLQADHIHSFTKYPLLRFDVNNGRTLCVECHKKTPNYGYKAILVKGGGANEFQRF